MYLRRPRVPTVLLHGHSVLANAKTGSARLTPTSVLNLYHKHGAFALNTLIEDRVHEALPETSTPALIQTVYGAAIWTAIRQLRCCGLQNAEVA
jgi:hypothetical protein